METQKEIIQDYELEAAVLGRVLQIKDDILLVADKLKPQHFFDPIHAQVYEAVLFRLNKTGIVDMSGVRTELNQRGLNIYSRIVEMCNLSGNIRDVQDPAIRLVDIWKRREMENLAKAILGRRQNNLDDFVQNKLYEILSEGQTTSVQIADAVFKAVEDTENRVKAFRNNEELPNTIYSGLSELDNMTGGFKSGELVIIGGRPGMGKSTLKRTIARNIARNYPVKIFSKEMIPCEIANLMICAEGSTDSFKVRKGTIRDDEHKAYMEGAGIIGGLDIEFDIITTLTNFRVSVKKWRMKTDMSKPAVVFLDYVQQLSAKGYQNKTLEIGAISDALKQMAISMNICVIALAQLSRAVEARGGDKRPILADLRESGNLEQDADGVIFCYRPEYYGFETDENGSSTQGMAELIIEKFRGGLTGTARAEFIGQYGKFQDWNADLKNFNPPF